MMARKSLVLQCKLAVALIIKFKAKTLIMTGEYDIGSTIEMSQELNKIIKNSQLKIIKNGKHLCGIECADDVNLMIKDFIEKNE